MLKRFSLVSLVLAGLLVLGGCDLFEDDEVGAGSEPADQNYSTTFTGAIHAITGTITSVTVHHDYVATATGPTPATVNCSNGLTLTGQISGNRLVAYGTDSIGNRVTMVATFWVDTSVTPNIVYMEGQWTDSRTVTF